jgi:hypothetical protein
VKSSANALQYMKCSLSSDAPVSSALRGCSLAPTSIVLMPKLASFRQFGVSCRAPSRACDQVQREIRRACQ